MDKIFYIIFKSRKLLVKRSSLLYGELSKACWMDIERYEDTLLRPWKLLHIAEKFTAFSALLSVPCSMLLILECKKLKSGEISSTEEI